MGELLKRMFGVWRMATRTQRGAVPAAYSPAVGTAWSAQDASDDGAARSAPAPSLRWAILVPAMLAVGLVGAALLPRDGAPFAARQVESVLAMLNLRSPGARATGNLVDTKPAVAQPAQRALGKTFAPPRERALGKVFPAQDAVVPGGEAPFVPPYQPDTLNLASPETPALSGPPPAGGGGGLGDGGGGGLGDGGGGGGGSPGGGGPDGGGGGGGVDPPVAAVPEPSTWLLMIVAFGLCGSMLRRQRRSDRRRLACDPAS